MERFSLFKSALTKGKRIAIRDRTGDYDYETLVSAARVCALELLKRRSTSDLDETRVAFLMKPSFRYAAVQWGIWAAGGVAVPIGIRHPPSEVEYVVNDSQATILIVDEDLRKNVANLASSCHLDLEIYSTEELLASEIETTLLPSVKPSRRAMILYTSGSTGKPKGVVTTHHNILSQVDSLVEAWEWTENDRILHVLPMHHVHGIVNVMTCALRVGACCEFLAPFAAGNVWDRFGTQPPLSLFMAVPTIYSKLITAYDAASHEKQSTWSTGAKSLRLMVSGSAALPVPVLERWQSMTGHRLLERYGMTEIGMALSNPLKGERRVGFVGKPLPGVIVSRADDEGQPVADDQPGEILVKGPCVFLEYWNREESTRASFREGWFRTGDIAIVDGYDFRILGRNSVDIIKTGGYKVSALEIEDELRLHPSIADCAVVGLLDDEWGERVAALVVLRAETQLTLESLRSWCKERLAYYKIPSRLLTGESLPRNAMGKVQKPEVTKRFKSQS